MNTNTAAILEAAAHAVQAERPAWMVSAITRHLTTLCSTHGLTPGQALDTALRAAEDQGFATPVGILDAKYRTPQTMG